MIAYIANRQGRVLCSASNLLQGNTITDDRIADDIQSGIKTLEISILATDEIKASAVPGNFVLIGQTDLSDECMMYQIITTTLSRSSETIEIYAEDAGLDLINKIVGSWKPSGEVTLEQAVQQILGSNSSGWAIAYGVSPTTKKGASLFDYTSEESAIARLQSVLEKFGLEMFFTYTIKGLEAIERTINIVEHRGRSEASHVFYYGDEIDEIVERISIENLATSFTLYGAEDKALASFSDYSTYSNRTITPSDPDFTGSRSHSYKVSGNSVTCIEAPELWGSNLTPDGKISQIKRTDYKSAKLLISYAITELEKVIEASRSYEITFNRIPRGVNCGDMIRIVDAHGDLYLEARLMAWEYSDTTGSFSTTLGSFSLLTSSKAEQRTITPTETAQRTIYSDTEPTASDYSDGDVWVKTTTTSADLFVNETYVHDGTTWIQTTLAPPTIGSSADSSIEFDGEGIGFLSNRAKLLAETDEESIWINLIADNLLLSNVSHSELGGGSPFLEINSYNRAEIGSGYAPDTWNIASVLTASDRNGSKVIMTANNGLIELKGGTSSSINFWSDSLKWNGQPIGGGGGSTAWDDITGKPSTFPPSAHNHDDRYYTESEIDALLTNKQDKITTSNKLAYNLLSGTPTIPTTTGELTNNSGFINQRELDNALDSKQDTLVSGVDIKTINGETLLGSGNITIQGGGGGSIACCSANSNNSGTVATSNDPATVVSLNRFNVLTDSSAFEFSGGGIKCRRAGVVQVNASIYLRVGSSSASTGTSGLYIRKNGAEIASNYSYTNNAYNTKGCTKIVSVNAGDVITLCSRTSSAGLCYPGNVATYLEIAYLS